MHPVWLRESSLRIQSVHSKLRGELAWSLCKLRVLRIGPVQNRMCGDVCWLVHSLCCLRGRQIQGWVFWNFDGGVL